MLEREKPTRHFDIRYSNALTGNCAVKSNMPPSMSRLCWATFKQFLAFSQKLLVLRAT